MAYAYEDKAKFRFDNTDGGTGEQIELELNASNFDFSQCRDDLFDIQFMDEADTTVRHVIYNPGEIGDPTRRAIVFLDLKMNPRDIRIAGSRWGDPAISTDQSDTSFLPYWNAGEDAADLARFTGFGVLTKQIVADANAPGGSAIEFDGTENTHNSLIEAFGISERASIYVTEAQQVGEAEGHWGGAFVDVLTGGEAGIRVGRSQAGSNAVQVTNLTSAAAFANRIAATASGEHPPAGTYIVQKTERNPSLVFTQVGSNIDLVAGGVQGLSRHKDVGYIYTAGDTIYRIDFAGAPEDSLNPTVGGSTWGDCDIVDIRDGNGLQCYLTRFDSTTPETKIYRVDPNDLASGVTEVADITASLPGSLSANGIKWDALRGVWLIGATGSSSESLKLYEFAQDWTFLREYMTSESGDLGYQGMTIWRNMVLANLHSKNTTGGGTICPTYSLNETSGVALAGPTLDTTQGDAQGKHYDPTSDLFYELDRTTTPDSIKVYQLTTDRTTQQFSVQWLHPKYAVGSAMSLPNEAIKGGTNIGIACYRQSRYCRLAVLETPFPRPLITTPSASGSIAAIQTAAEIAAAAAANNATVLADIDPIIDAVLTTTNKLDPLIDGGNGKFTAAALVEAPSGGGTVDVSQVETGERRVVLKNIPGKGLVGEFPRTIKVGEDKLWSIDFREDMPVNGRFTGSPTVTLHSGTEGGITFTTAEEGYDKSLMKIKPAGVTAGTYVIRCAGSYGPNVEASIGHVTLVVAVD